MNPFEEILPATPIGLAARPTPGRLAGLARSSKFINDGLLAHLAELIERLDDVVLVGDDIAIHLIKVGYCDAKYANATAFASALAARLRRYIDHPISASDARCDFRERIAWCMAVARASELRKWPAIVLTEVSSGT